jgi:peptide/nickel transport system ATP-binding protein
VPDTVSDAVPETAAIADAILDVADITVEYDTASGAARAVDGVSLQVARGEFLGIVGESGCGKSTLLFAIAQLLSPPAQLVSGRVIFKGRDMVKLSAEALRASRWRDYSVVMQSAMNALNPVKTIAAQYEDAMRAHGTGDRGAIRARSREVLALVGIDAIHLKSYPHQLSGGMRQRVMIAMALLLSPDLIVMDEPTSALDVVAQRSLMVQVKELQRRLAAAVCQSPASLYARAAGLLPLRLWAEGAALGHSGRAARSRRPAEWLPLPPALPRCDAALRRGRARSLRVRFGARAVLAL